MAQQLKARLWRPQRLVLEQCAHALGAPGGPRRVQHVRAFGLVGDRHRRLIVERDVEKGESIDRPVDRIPVLDCRFTGPHRRGDV